MMEPEKRIKDRLSTRGDPLAGRCVLIGVNQNGETTDARMPVEFLREHIDWIGLIVPEVFWEKTEHGERACDLFEGEGMTELKPRPGFDWDHVAWGKPNSPPSALCCYCSAAIGEDDVPLIMWSRDGHAAQFCDDCMRKWWEFE